MWASLNRGWLVDYEDAFVTGSNMVKDGAILILLSHKATS
jgi:hypothetical protein